MKLARLWKFRGISRNTEKDDVNVSMKIFICTLTWETVKRARKD